MTTRIVTLDALRGIAIIAMVIYHGAWDLEFLGFADLGVATSAGWRWSAYIIAGSFLTVSGVSLALMTTEKLRLLAFFRRLAVVALCAGAISAATYALTPDTFIYFGILHSIAVGSVICLVFTRTHPALVALVGAAVLWLGITVSLPALDHPFWLWTGLQPTAWLASDYVPVFPWTGLMLLGLAIGRWLSRHDQVLETLASIEPGGAISRALMWMGRNSLLIYMVHQPLLIGALMGVAAISWPGAAPGDRGILLDLNAPGEAVQTANFLSSCESNCREAGGGDLCITYCSCVLTELQETPLWMNDDISDAEMAADPQFLDVIQFCQADLQPPPPQ